MELYSERYLTNSLSGVIVFLNCLLIYYWVKISRNFLWERWIQKRLNDQMLIANANQVNRVLMNCNPMLCESVWENLILLEPDRLMNIVLTPVRCEWKIFKYDRSIKQEVHTRWEATTCIVSLLNLFRAINKTYFVISQRSFWVHFKEKMFFCWCFGVRPSVPASVCSQKMFVANRYQFLSCKTALKFFLWKMV